jgi:surface antigen
MTRTQVVAFLVLSVLMAACQSGNQGTSETTGAVISPIGSQTSHGANNAAAAPPNTVLIGNFGGNQLGSAINDADRRRAAATEKRAFTAPLGQQVTWSNPDDGNSGTITPVRDGYAANGAYCREFQQTIIVGGQQQKAYDKACQQPDGSWKIVQ